MAANTVPVEILRQIFSYLVFTDLVRVSIVSQSWYAACVESLYKSPRLFTQSLITFLRTILTTSLEPLRTHVRTLSLTWSIFHLTPIDPGVLSIFRAAAKQHELRLPTSMSIDSLVPLLLHLLPRVHTLHLFPPGSATRHNAFLGANPTSTQLPLALRSVRHLSCTWFSHTRGVSSALLLTMLTLPNIASLEVHILADIDHGFPTSASVTSRVARLHISYSEITLTSLARILAVPCALRELVFCSVSAVGSISVKTLYAALAPVRPTLEILELRFRAGRSTAGALVRWKPERDTFRDWPVLRRLRCAMRVLVGDVHPVEPGRVCGVLSRGLLELAVEVDVSWDGGHVVQELEELMRRRVDVVPCFRRVVVDLGGVNTPLRWGRLRTLCEAAGVELVSDVGSCDVDGM